MDGWVGLGRCITKVISRVQGDAAEGRCDSTVFDVYIPNENLNPVQNKFDVFIGSIIMA